MYQTPFRIDPSYNEEKVVFITPDVAETYAPVKISVPDSGSAGSVTAPGSFVKMGDARLHASIRIFPIFRWLTSILFSGLTLASFRQILPF
jgi:hypothetical protein